MEKVYDKAYALYIETISGTLSLEDKTILANELANNASFRGIWESLNRQGAAIELQIFSQGINPTDELILFKQNNKIKGVTNYKSNNKNDEDLIISPIANNKEANFASTANRLIMRPFGGFAKIAAVVALFFLFGGLAYYFIITHKKITNNADIVQVINNNKQSIRLQLSSGKMVDISKHEANKTIVLGHSTLAISANTMHFNSKDLGINTLMIPPGENYQIVLSDGTVVRLNAGTTLRFPFHFSGNLREVYLDGEAFFKVAKDATHPFIVHTPLTDVKVLGTQFNVNTYHKGAVTTALVEGNVQTQSKEGNILSLKPGFEAKYQTGNGFVMDKFDQEQVLSWMDGIYYFHDQSIASLVDVMARCYGVEVILDKDKLQSITVTGVMDKKNLPEFLDDLQTTASIKYYYANHQLHLQ